MWLFVVRDDCRHEEWIRLGEGISYIRETLMQLGVLPKVEGEIVIVIIGWCCACVGLLYVYDVCQEVCICFCIDVNSHIRILWNIVAVVVVVIVVGWFRYNLCTLLPLELILIILLLIFLILLILWMMRLLFFKLISIIVDICRNL